MLDGERFVMRGFNYYPRDYGWTSMADWDWEAVDRELALAASLHANTIRTGISWQYTTGNVNNRYNVFSRSGVTPESLEALDRLLDIADRHGLKVVLWLMDGIYPELWQPANFEVVEAHLQTLIPHYADDPRIAAWDLMTDIDGAMLQRPPVGCFGEFPACTKENMLAFLRREAAAVRQLDANHLITVGFCWPASSLLAQDFTDFLAPQFLGGDHPELLEADRIQDIEDYGRWDELLTDRASATDRVEDKVRWIQARMEHPMPLVLAEYGLPSGGLYSSPQLQQAVYASVLEVAFLRTELAGALNWALTDFLWPPKASTSYPLDAPMSSAEERSFGVLDMDYYPKPAAEVASAFYAASPRLTIQTNPDELRFVFNHTFVPGGEDTRELAVAFDAIRFLGENNRRLLELDVGDPSARPYLASGFFDDEGPWGTESKNFAWTGGPQAQATVQVPFPDGTRRIEIRALSGDPGIDMQILIDGEVMKTLTPRTRWSTIGLDLPTTDSLQAGDPLMVRGRFNIPVEGGSVSLQMSADQVTWSDVASATPHAGRVTLSIPAPAGAHSFRLTWIGAGLYGPAVSDVLQVKVMGPPSPVPPTATHAPAATPTPPQSSTPAGDHRWPAMLAVGLIVLVGVGGLWLLRRSSRARRAT